MKSSKVNVIEMCCIYGSLEELLSYRRANHLFADCQSSRKFMLSVSFPGDPHRVYTEGSHIAA